MPPPPSSPLPPFIPARAFRTLPTTPSVSVPCPPPTLVLSFTVPIVPLPSVIRPPDQCRPRTSYICSCAVLLTAGLRISALSQPPNGFLLKPVAILLPQALSPPPPTFGSNPSPTSLLHYAPPPPHTHTHTSSPPPLHPGVSPSQNEQKVEMMSINVGMYYIHVYHHVQTQMIFLLRSVDGTLC